MSPEPRPREWPILLVTGIAHAWCHTLITMFSPFVAPREPVPGGGLAAALGTDVEGTGWAVTGMTCLFGLAAVPAGFLVARWGPRAMLALFLAGGATAVATTALAGSPPLFLLGMLAIGGAAAIYHPAGLTLVSREIRKRGAGFGIHGALGNVGIALAPALAFGLARWLGGFRAAFLLLAFPGVPLAAAALALPPGPGSEADRALEAEGSDRGAGPLRTGLLLATISLVGMAYRGMMTYLPALLGGMAAGIPAGLLPDAARTGAALATGALAVGVLGQLLGGALSDRFRGEALETVFLLVAGAGLAAAGVAGALALGDGTGAAHPGASLSFLALASAGLAALAIFGQQPVKNGLVARYVPRSRRGEAYGFYFAIDFGVGALGAGIGGVAIARAGIGQAFMLLGGLAAGGMVLAALLWFLAVRKA